MDGVLFPIIAPKYDVPGLTVVDKPVSSAEEELAGKAVDEDSATFVSVAPVAFTEYKPRI